MNTEKLLILGAGGHGEVVAEIAQSCGFKDIFFLDDTCPHAIGKLNDLESFLLEFPYLALGIGNNSIRHKLQKKAELLGFYLPTLVHDTAYISPSVSLGMGTVVAPMACIHTRSEIGKGCIISAGAIIDHDVRIEDFVHINSGAIIKAGGNVVMEHKIDAGQIVNGF